jgi:vacuolar-type H+-ATPase subunit E/Vma4
LQADAERKAEQIVADAMERADRIRAESDRELAAATQRRNAINAQLSNVRQMLATLQGAGASAADEPEEADA